MKKILHALHKFRKKTHTKTKSVEKNKIKRNSLQTLSIKTSKHSTNKHKIITGNYIICQFSACSQCVAL